MSGETNCAPAALRGAATDCAGGELSASCILHTNSQTVKRQTPSQILRPAMATAWLMGSAPLLAELGTLLRRWVDE